MNDIHFIALTTEEAEALRAAMVDLAYAVPDAAEFCERIVKRIDRVFS